MAAGRELEEVEGEDGAGFETGDVAERADEFLAVFVGVVDYQGSAALAVTTASQLAFAGTQLARLLHLFAVGDGADGGQECEGCRGLCECAAGECGGGDDEGDFGDGGDVVAACEEE